MQHPNHCARTCRSLFPNEPETWCSGCVRDEADEREENYQRWRESEAARRIAVTLIREHAG